MMSPLLNTTRMPSKQVRFMLIMYIVRHTIGVVVFGGLIVVSIQNGGVMAFLMPVAGVAYIGTAIYNGWKMLGQYRRNKQKERLLEERNASA